ncbi:hypothetical protein [Mesorhizobium sp. B2-4-14]|nr:hypothetical protein [Mesorhizobium sp. B2-4-14]
MEIPFRKLRLRRVEAYATIIVAQCIAQHTDTHRSQRVAWRAAQPDG